MATLDKVIQMQTQGIQDAEIIRTLREQGINPREINDALNQAKIKSAVSQDNQQNISGYPQPTEQSQYPQDMQQSIMQGMQQPPGGETIPQQPQQTQISSQQIQPSEEQQYYQDYYPEMPQAYPEQAYYPPQPAIDTNTITEITEQIISEKFQEFKEKIGDISILKNELQEKIKDLDERLKRIENSINQLEQAIIGKIGEFGETASYIHKDLGNLHDTVSKLMNPLIDNYRELKRIAGKKNI